MTFLFSFWSLPIHFKPRTCQTWVLTRYCIQKFCLIALLKDFACQSRSKSGFETSSRNLKPWLCLSQTHQNKDSKYPQDSKTNQCLPEHHLHIELSNYFFCGSFSQRKSTIKYNMSSIKTYSMWTNGATMMNPLQRLQTLN